MAIVTLNKHGSAEIPFYSNLEAVAISISLPKRIHICNIYISNSFTLELQDLEDLIAQLPAPLILSGDFNSNHTLCGSTITDRKEKPVENLLNNQDLISLNTDSPTHLSISNGKTSAIDLTFSSPQIAQHLKWDTSKELYDSGHFPIKITYGDNTTTTQNYLQPKWHIRKTNWPIYQENIVLQLT